MPNSTQGKEYIDVSGYLKELNRRLKDYNSLRSRKKLDIQPLDCKSLAERIGVTAATISNLSTDSKYSLISDIVDEICFVYYDLFRIMDIESNKDNSEDNGYQILRDFKYIMWDLMTTYK